MLQYNPGQHGFYLLVKAATYCIESRRPRLVWMTIGVDDPPTQKESTGAREAPISLHQAMPQMAYLGLDAGSSSTISGIRTQLPF